MRRARNRSTSNPPVVAPEPIQIDSLDMDARGVGRMRDEDGNPSKVIFVEGALPGELVTYASYRRKPKFEQATLVDVLKPSVQRTTAKCKHYGACGGCSMQHIDARAQLAFKQRILEDDLWYLSKLRPELMLRPIAGPDWGYRYRSRLSARYVAKKGGVLVGFHEKKSAFVAEMDSCEILPPHISDLLLPLRDLIGALSIFDKMPQIEVAVGHDVTALVLRNMVTLNTADEVLVRAFADLHQVQFWLQPKGPDTAYPFYPLDVQLAYTLPEFNVTMPFKPTDFTQVNPLINRSLISKALRLLAVEPNDRVLDLFCGIGNFTLPLATQAREVMGVEGSEAMTRRALENAEKNGLAHKTSFACRNLFEVTAADIADLGSFDRWLIDPPRDGALAISIALGELAKQGAQDAAAAVTILPKRIVYVSCNPATLARDAGILVNEAGYRLSGAGIVNMFPHTSHVESIAVFDR